MPEPRSLTRQERLQLAQTHVDIVKALGWPPIEASPMDLLTLDCEAMLADVAALERLLRRYCWDHDEHPKGGTINGECICALCEDTRAALPPKEQQPHDH